MGQLEGAVVQDAGGVRGAAGEGSQGADLYGSCTAHIKRHTGRKLREVRCAGQEIESKQQAQQSQITVVLQEHSDQKASHQRAYGERAPD
jgi:hypothetical protein